METPKSNSKCIKPRKHLPTPKMSERKKALFTSRSRNSPTFHFLRGDSDEDSDLGIMSPLQCSSSPTRYDYDDSGPFSFTNVLAKYSLHGERKSHNIDDEYEIVSATNKSPLIEHPEETEIHTPTTPNLSNAWIDMSQVLDLSAPITLLTPHRTSTKEKTPKSLFPKSMVAKDVDVTPEVEDQTEKHSRPMTQGKDSKARTSLFNEGSISTKSFYSLNATSTGFKGVSQSNSIMPLIRKTSKTISYHRHNRPTYRTSKRNDINRGVFHKIHKQRKRKTSLKRGITKVKKEQQFKAAINIIEKPLLNASSDNENDRRKHQRVQELLRNMVDPIELARPLNIDVPRSNPHASLDDEESSTEKPENETSLMDQILNSCEPTSTITKNRKFFKSKTNKRAKYEVMKGVSAYLDQGKLFLEKQAEKSKKRKLHSLFDDDLVFDEEQQEVDDILKSLTDPESNQNKTETPLKELHNNVMSSTQISNLASKFAEMNSVSDEKGATPKEKVFPLFETGPKSTNLHENKTKRIKGNEWRPIGDDQLQIDAGQKAFGAIECKTCQFIYTQHVPEDEQLHQQFHNSCQILNFKGWEKENRVLDIYEWGVSGRIISISNLDPKSKVQRTHEILKVADMELGFGQTSLHPSVMIYLACNNKEVMGLCVAQPLSTANKLISDFGIDFCSSETYAVKCGISRIWVNAKHRRKGVASKLLEAVKCHFVYGCRLSNDEIAFSAPTEAGKAFAEKVMGKKDFLVYQ